MTIDETEKKKSSKKLIAYSVLTVLTLAIAYLILQLFIQSGARY